MNVISLFDGKSCGRVALQRLGVHVKNYYASEIDTHAIRIAQKNFPDTKQVGNVVNLKHVNWKETWIDLLIGGSPCQGFSFAGKQLNFEDHRSKLFFEFVRILEEIRLVNPDVKFLLENVKMKKIYQDVISKYLGVEPIEINSSVVSGQNRKRLYWTNIQGFVMPEDKGILVKHILQDEISTSYLLSGKAIEYMSRNRNGKPRWEYHGNPLEGKASCITANCHKGVPYLVVKDSGMIIAGKDEKIKGHDILKRVYSPEGKSPTLTANSGGNQHAKISINDQFYRRLTPIECERLQTLPDNYTEGVSDSQRYKMLGNGWTIDVIVELLRPLLKTEWQEDLTW